MIWYDMTWYDMILYIHDIWYFFPISYPYNMETHKICVFVSGSFLTKSSTWTFPLHTQGWYSSAKGVVVGLVVGWVVGSQLSSQGKTSSAKIAALLRTWMSEYWVGLGALSRSKQHRGSATGSLRVWDGHISLLHTFQHGSIKPRKVQYLLHQTGYPTISWLTAFFSPQNGHAMAG